MQEKRTSLAIRNEQLDSSIHLYPRSRSPHQCQTDDTQYGTQSQLSEQCERVNNNVIAANSAVSGIQLCQRQVFLPARVTQMDHAPCAQRDVHRARTPGALRGGGQR